MEATTTPNPMATTAEELFRKGNQAYKDLDCELACSFFKQAIDLQPVYPEAYNNWGVALSDLFEQTGDDKLMAACIDKYRKATKLKPRYATAYYNWANLLLEVAEMKDDENLYAESLEKYRLAAKITPNDADVYFSWANAMMAYAELRKDDLDEKMYEMAYKRFARALELRPDDAEIYSNWAMALSSLAHKTKNTELYEQAFEKYSQAVNLRPESIRIRFNWGLDLIDYAKLKGGVEKFRTEIESKLMGAYKLKSGKALYNLTCFYSSIGEIDAAMCWFEDMLENTSVPRSYLEIEPDFENIRTDKRFNELLDKYRPE